MKPLHIGILSGPKKNYERTRMIAAIKRRGHKSSFIRLKHVVFDICHHQTLITYRGKDLRELDALIFRIYDFQLNETAALAKYLRGHVILVDQEVGNLLPSHKIHNAVVLSKARIPQPRTFFSMDRDLLFKRSMTFGPPFVVKDPMGRRGKGVYLVKSQEALRKKLQRMKVKRPLIVQEVLDADEDFRILVLDGKVLGAIRRHSKGFLNNFSQGGSVEKAILSPSILRIAQRAAGALRYDIAGVDIMMSRGKPYVLEVNSIPQWKGFDLATHSDAADRIIELIEKRYERKYRHR